MSIDWYRTKPLPYWCSVLTDSECTAIFDMIDPDPDDMLTVFDVLQAIMDYEGGLANPYYVVGLMQRLTA